MVIGEESTPSNLVNKHNSKRQSTNIAPMPTDKCNLHPSLQPADRQGCGAESQWIHLQNRPTAKAQGSLQKKKQKDCKP